MEKVTLCPLPLWLKVRPCDHICHSTFILITAAAKWERRHIVIDSLHFNRNFLRKLSLRHQKYMCVTFKCTGNLHNVQEFCSKLYKLNVHTTLQQEENVNQGRVHITYPWRLSATRCSLGPRQCCPCSCWSHVLISKKHCLPGWNGKLRLVMRTMLLVLAIIRAANATG